MTIRYSEIYSYVYNELYIFMVCIDSQYPPAGLHFRLTKASLTFDVMQSVQKDKQASFVAMEARMRRSIDDLYEIKALLKGKAQARSYQSLQKSQSECSHQPRDKTLWCEKPESQQQIPEDWKLKLDTIHQEKVELASQVNCLVESLNKESAKVAQLESDLQAKKQALSEATQTTFERAQLLDEVKQEIAEKNQALNETRQTIADKEKELTKAKQSATEKDQVLDRLALALTEREDELSKLKQESTERAQTLDEANQLASECKRSIEEAKEETQKKKQELRESREELLKRKQELREAREKNLEQQQNLDEARVEIAKKEKKLKECQQNVEQLEDRIEEKEKELKECATEQSSEVEELYAQIEKLKEENMAMEKKYQELDSAKMVKSTSKSRIPMRSSSVSTRNSETTDEITQKMKHDLLRYQDRLAEMTNQNRDLIKALNRSKDHTDILKTLLNDTRSESEERLKKLMMLRGSQQK
ncbi:hypothetical protein BY458DRAFT_492392 [Sporodiniella umbellata]|nr:hypothetical protein BY458DRAFT_492392 [Sporodiniella umbellata]